MYFNTFHARGFKEFFLKSGSVKTTIPSVEDKEVDDKGRPQTPSS